MVWPINLNGEGEFMVLAIQTVTKAPVAKAGYKGPEISEGRGKMA